MKKQGFGKDDLKPQETQEEVLINEEKADEIILEVLIGVAKEISVQAGLPIDHDVEQGLKGSDFLNALLGGLGTVGVQLELSKIEHVEGKPLMSVLVKQTVGQIDLSEAVTKKEDK